jgi:hypothetical protein
MTPAFAEARAGGEAALRGIQPGELDRFWPTAAPLLERGLKHGAGYRWTLAALRRSIAENKRYLWLTWPAQDCAVVTQIEDYPAAKLLQILWVCGRLPENWRAVLAALERWGAQRGCTEVETGGRFGWERQLAEAGYSSVPWVTLRKEI